MRWGRGGGQRAEYAPFTKIIIIIILVEYSVTARVIYPPSPATRVVVDGGGNVRILYIFHLIRDI